MLRFLLLVISTLFLPLQVFAWGSVGHRTVAEIAEGRLTPGARLEVQKLLASEGNESLSDIATWADEVRSLKIPRQPSHIVDLPLDNSPYDPALECKGNMCVIGMIEASIPALADRTLPTSARMMALKYLVHLIGDVHQPLHATRAGFETVTFRGKRLSIHEVWDSSIIQAHKVSFKGLAARIETNFAKDVPYRSPVEWALESRAIARDTIFAELPVDLFLPDDYADQNWHIVEERLHEAGWRLAATLNKAFASNGSELN